MTRRQRLHAFWAMAVLIVSLIGLINQAGTNAEAESPPELTCEAAVYRPDGGQAIEAGAAGRPNELSLLNCGRRLDLASADPNLLAALPGLGERSAVRAQGRGRLTERERARLGSLIKEPGNGRPHP